MSEHKMKCTWYGRNVQYTCDNGCGYVENYVHESGEFTGFSGPISCLHDSGESLLRHTNYNNHH